MSRIFVGDNSTDSAISDDSGASWTAETQPLSFSDVKWNGTVFCGIVSGSRTAYTSTDGVSWTSHPNALPAARSWKKMCWGGSVFCAVSSFGAEASATSSDGVTWTDGNAPGIGTPQNISSNGTTFVLVSGNGSPVQNIATSTDGLNWTARDSVLGSIEAICWDGSKFIAPSAGISNQCQVSADGISGWTIHTMSRTSTGSWRSCISNGTITISFDDGSASYSSTPDGTTWTTRTLPITPSNTEQNLITWNGVAFIFIKGTSSNIAYTSTDGINWNSITLPATSQYNMIRSKFLTYATINSF